MSTRPNWIQEGRKRSVPFEVPESERGVQRLPSTEASDDFWGKESTDIYTPEENERKLRATRRSHASEWEAGKKISESKEEKERF